MAANVIALGFTVVFARVLGSDGYGSLITLLAAFLVLAIPGQALQVAVAREVSSEVEGHDPALAPTCAAGRARSWRWRWCVAVRGALAREPLADLIGVDLEWGAAVTLPDGLAWLLLCIQRGVLQGMGSYALVGASLHRRGGGAARVRARPRARPGWVRAGAFLGTGRVDRADRGGPHASAPRPPAGARAG